MADLETIEKEAAWRGDGLVARTINAVIDLIQSGGLRQGDPLPSESALAKRFGVSRIVMREANRSLSALGIVEMGNGRGARVSMPDENVVGLLLDHVVHTRHVTVQQVLDVRRSLEVRAAALAALRRSDEEAKAILAHAEAMRTAFDDPDDIWQHDVALHAAVADASQNPLFAIMIKAFAPVTKQTWPLGWKNRTLAEREVMIAEHEAIARSIADQDIVAAREAMSSHFDDTVRVLAGAGVT
ncbi:FadR/GntR family transcriptional regulator [Sphingomonas sp. Tas61C01]|uniref:FadR/GntR family transcriptional regulator n=1 Tax=Sphingomonas sp. Tas61C01 TaxID=3458297 RepID=UPI00403E6FE3